MANTELQTLAGWPEGGPSFAPEDVSREAPWCTAKRQTEGCVEVQLAGVFPSDWSVRLTHACAARGISLVKGYARHLRGEIWLAQLKLDLGFAEATDPDFLELATEPVSPTTFAEPRLLDFELSDSAAHGGSLLLEVHAWDGLGLLAAVLGCAASAGLYAREFVLETQDEVAFQHLALQNEQRGWPVPAQTRRLERILQRRLVGS